MSVMKRSKAQVIRGYLPGATFEHPNETIVRVIWTPTSRAEVNKDLLLEALSDRLEQWAMPDAGGGPALPRTSGYLQPVTDHPDEYAVVEPDGPMFYKTWPLVMRCTNDACRKAVSFDNEAEWQQAARHHPKRDPAFCDRKGCGAPRRQFEYMLVHHCGNDRPLLIPPCKVKDGAGKEHGYKHVCLYDTRTFETSTWRCRHGACGASGGIGRRISGMRMPGCGCGMQPPTYRHVTMRQDIRFNPHTLKLVTFDPTPMKTLRSVPGSETVVVGSYLEFFTDDWREALEEVGKDRGKALARWERMRKLLEADGASHEEMDETRRDILGTSGGAFDAIEGLVADDPALHDVGARLRARERTLIWGGGGGGEDLSVWRMQKFRDAAAAGGRGGAVQVIDDAKHKLDDYGFSDLLVVDNFPVALAAFGYTRIGRHPSNSMLRAFPGLKSGPAKNRNKTPIYCSATTTEAVFFELDAERVISWLSANSALKSAVPPLPDRALNDGLDRRRATKAFMLRESYRHPEVSQLCLLLQHTLAHALIKNLGERSGFGEDTMSEYLIPETLTVGLFADVHQELSLGALVALVEHRLGEWLDAAAEGAEDCEWDPHCSEHDGACMACLHLSFGCDHLNGLLDRAVLFGSPERDEDKLSVDMGFWEPLPPLP